MGLFNNSDDLEKILKDLTKEIKLFREVKQTEFEWLKSHFELATKQDLIEMEKRMALKVSELNTTVQSLRDQVVKIWGEQQTKYDALVVEFNRLKEQLDDAEVPADAVASIEAFQLKLKEFDDSIPDTSA